MPTGGFGTGATAVGLGGVGVGVGLGGVGVGVGLTGPRVVTGVGLEDELVDAAVAAAEVEVAADEVAAAPVELAGAVLAAANPELDAAALDPAPLSNAGLAAAELWCAEWLQAALSPPSAAIMMAVAAVLAVPGVRLMSHLRPAVPRSEVRSLCVL